MCVIMPLSNSNQKPTKLLTLYRHRYSVPLSGSTEQWDPVSRGQGSCPCADSCPTMSRLLKNFRTAQSASLFWSSNAECCVWSSK